MGFRKTPEDDALWRAVTASVTPLERRKKKRPVKLTAVKQTAGEAKTKGAKKETVRKPKRSIDMRPATPPPVTVRSKTHPELSHGTAPDVDRRTAMRLHRGQMPIQGRLDLHGRIQDDAYRALISFIDSAHATGRRSVLIITGKGQGVLKNAVPRWLNQPPLRSRILSFSYAQQKDGGSGALYVLIRRKRS